MADPPTIEFPCDYPIKVIGEMRDGFVDEVLAIVRRHDDTVADDRVTRRDSAQGNYASITIVLRATGEMQLQDLFLELKACTSVRMVL